jgi:molecular chaperone GrpE
MPDDLTPQLPTPVEPAADATDRSAPTPEAAPAGEAPAPGAAALADLQRQRDEYHDRLLRTAAEFDNYRKRVERERRDLAETAAADVLTDLLGIVDDFERALQIDITGDDAAAYRRGVELIHQQLLDLLRKRGVTPIAALGADFDPRYHQAVIHEPSDQHRDGEVMAELRRGYRLGERLLRPAMVKVAKA